MSTDIAQLIERRRHEGHPCIVPRCSARAGAALHVGAPTRLAGRDWRTGEMVDLCWGHFDELRHGADYTRDLGYGGQFGEFAVYLDGPDPLFRFREWID